MRPTPEAQALYDLARQASAAGRSAESAAAWQQLAQLVPESAELLNNLANELTDLGRYDEALAAYDRAILFKPDQPDIRWNRGLVLLALNRLQEGFADYEWRWSSPRLRAIYDLPPGPRWRGEPLGGRTILLYAEQGFGDAIQFVRYVPMVKESGAGRVVLVCAAPLVRLMRGVAGVDEVIAAGSPIAPCDVHCPLLSLAHVFGTTRETIPAATPYLRADDADVSRLSSRLASLGPARLNVGVAWSGRPTQKYNARRALAASLLMPLTAVAGVRLVSLQKAGDPQGLPMVDWTGDLKDLADTAALMKCLDVIVTPDMGLAHLAGALARPAIAMLQHVPDWRWRQSTDGRSDWYPTTRLVRQESPGDWAGVVARVAAMLDQHQLTGQISPCSDP